MNFNSIFQAATGYVWGDSTGNVVDYEAGYPYCRSGNGKREELESILLRYTHKDLDKKAEVVVFPSGMNAICCIVEIALRRWKNDKCTPHLVFGDELYCDTTRTLEYFRETRSFTYETVNVKDRKKIEEILFLKGKNLALWFFETCTNPSGQMCDFEEVIPSIKKKTSKCIICMDNTWTSFHLFNPFDYGADIVVESMTKYISGGTCIGGMVVGRCKLIKSIRRWTQIYGQFMTPGHCQLLINGIQNMKERLEKGSNLTIKIADWLEKSGYPSRVLYPLLESHPTYKINLKYLKDGLGPSVILFHLPVEITDDSNPKKRISDLLEGNPGIRLETSYGSSYSKICPWAKYGLNDMYEDPFKFPKKGIWLRLSVGYKDNFDSLKDALMTLIGRSLTLDVNNDDIL